MAATTVARGRRRRVWVGVALVLVTALVAAACGGNDGGARKPAASEDTGAYDPNGVMRYASDLSAAANVAFDPIKTFRQTDEPYLAALYDTLLRKRPNGQIVPGLAESAKEVDASTIEVKLRPGLKFTDGTPLDANAARFSLLRIRNSGNTQAFKGEMTLLKDVVVVDPTTFRIVLEKPSAGAYFPLLTGSETTVVSPTAAQKAGWDLNRQPVGAGPFTLVSYSDNQKIVFKKNPDHWDAKNVKLGGFEVIAIPAGPQNQTALRAHQVDMIGISPTDVAQLEGTFGIYSRGESDSVMFMPMCKSRKPLDDVRVRQALNYATNRDELNQGVLNGKGEPMQALFTKDSPQFPKSLEGKYKYDPAKAKQLLQQAGVPDGTEIGVIIIAGNQSSQRYAEIVQQQWAKVGIKLKIVPSTNIVEDFFVNAREPLFILPFARAGVSKVTTMYVGDTAGNVCDYNNPTLTALTDQLAALNESSPEGVKLWGEIQQLVFDQALSVFGLFTPVVWAYDQQRIGGMGVISQTIGYPDFLSIYVKK